MKGVNHLCIICETYQQRKDVLMENESCFVMRYYQPVNFGHLIIAPKEHKSSFFELSYKEYYDMNVLFKNTKSYLDSHLSPDGYNIGFNIGKWAGQNIEHCHAHFIPRYAGDVPATELKGGICNFKKPQKGA